MPPVVVPPSSTFHVTPDKPRVGSRSVWPYCAVAHTLAARFGMAPK